jgi:cytochrome c-type biogenesis protein
MQQAQSPHFKNPFSSSFGRWSMVLVLIVLACIVALGWLAIVKTGGRVAQVQTAGLRTAQITDLTKSLTQTGPESEGVSAEVILASKEFFRLTNRTADGVKMGADKYLVFVANETVHEGDLPHHFGPYLKIDGTSVRVATDSNVLIDSYHHRTTVMVFGDVPQSLLAGSHTLEMVMPQLKDGSLTVLTWYTPIDYPDSVEQPQALSFGLILSLGAGLLAAISPCLLQLTAFYLPTLAGVGMDKATGNQRRRVFGTAVLFVLGFTIPYTAGGFLMGGMGQALAESGVLNPTGPIAIISGAAMLVMAGFVAYRARAPLVCRMPMPRSMQQSRRLPYVETFVSGFAIATGCLACFGGAILAVLLVYTGLLGSALMGGLAMFLFSLGIAIPFLLAAVSMSWIIPIATRLQRLTPAIGLVSALVMFFFGLTMITGNFHVVSGWLFQHLPLG